MTAHASTAQIMREQLEGPVAAARASLPSNPDFNNDALATEYVDVRTRAGSVHTGLRSADFMRTFVKPVAITDFQSHEPCTFSMKAIHR